MLRRQTNLPTHTTPFVGRESELEALVRILNSPAGRLITVLAPGGVGKTRLAAELARQNLEAFEDGVFLVDLTALTASAHIIIAVAEAVTLPLVEGKRTPKQQLLDFLSGRQILLVMDNCEHLIDELSLITEILETAEHVKILATSRRRLELAGETVFHLYGLDLRDCETPEEALTHAAVKLFVNSAVRINPTFRLTAHNLKAVIQICHLTAGMPLGIVLAAGWLAMLSPEEIAAEITQSIGFLEATGSKVSERQRSIQAVLDYSWQMLSEDEQHIAQKLSIFHGGFTRDAAQTVTGATLHQLMNLVTQSIIRRNIETGHYSIHELMRQYAEEKLSVSGDYQVVCSAHLTYYAAWMRERLPMLLGPREFDALNAIEADFENVRAAWQWGVASESWPQLREIVEPLSLFAVMRVRMDDVFPLFRQVINRFMPSEALNEAEASLLSWVVGWYANVEDTPHTEFEQTARYGLEIAHRLQDRRAIAWCLYRLVESAYIQGHMQEAIRLGDEAIALFRELGDNAGLFIALCDSGVFHSMTGSEVLSIIRTEESLSIARTMGSKLRIGRALNNIAANLPPHRSDEAIEMHNEALRLWQELNSPHRIGWILGVIAITALIALRRDDATAPLQQMKSIAHDTDDPGVNYTVHGLEMFLNFADERYAEALAASEQALVCAERIGNYAAVHNVRAARCALLAMLDAFDACREGLKVSAPLVTGVFGFDLINLFNVSFATLRLIERAGDDQTCLELLSAHLHHADIWPYFREHPYIVRLQARLRLDLDTEVYQAAWERGKTRDLETYVQTLIAAME